MEETLAGVEADLKAAKGQVESQVDEIAGLVVAVITSEARLRESFR